MQYKWYHNKVNSEKNTKISGLDSCKIAHYTATTCTSLFEKERTFPFARYAIKFTWCVIKCKIRFDEHHAFFLKCRY